MSTSRSHRPPPATTAPTAKTPKFSSLDPRNPDNSEILDRIAGGAEDPYHLTGDLPAPAKEEGGGILGALGLTVGDWKMGFEPTMSTSDEYDDPGTRDRAARQRQDEMAEGHDRRSTPPK
jgi:hypothetical protein